MWEKTWLLIIFHPVGKNKTGHSLGRHYIFKSCDRWMNYKTLWPELIHFTASNPIRKDNFLFGSLLSIFIYIMIQINSLIIYFKFPDRRFENFYNFIFFIQSYICRPLIEPSFNLSMNFPLVFWSWKKKTENPRKHHLQSVL